MPNGQFNSAIRSRAFVFHPLYADKPSHLSGAPPPAPHLPRGTAWPRRKYICGSQAGTNCAARVKTGTDAVGKTRSFTYNKNGSLLQNDLTIAAVAYDRTQYGYDASDRRTSSTDFGSGTTGGITSTVYDVAGNPIKITNPDGFAITFQYDEANRAIRAMDQEGNQVFTHRDVDGRPKPGRAEK